MLELILLRPGSTDFDEQGRITGRLDIPLSPLGLDQVGRAVAELADKEIDAVYVCPCQSAIQTGETLADGRGLKVKKLDRMANLDHGLWHGKLIAEVKQNQPRVYRQWQDKPETVCPPGGETVAVAMQRVEQEMTKLLKRHRNGIVALVAPEPLASLVRAYLSHGDIGNLWEAECENANWESLQLPQPAGQAV